ncbi:MAG: hypothetical protein GY775_07725 [Candidatus Scalindua sp.]|nr:hypothetical protein [Candidatus Scalindua sp.]
MMNIKSAISVLLLFLILPGCLARYGEGRLDQLLLSVNDLKKECNANNEELTEERIKEKLGRPGFLKPIYEQDLDLSSLDTLEKDAGILLIPNRAELYKDMLTAVESEKLSSIKLLSYVYDRMGSSEATSLTFYIRGNEDTGRKRPGVFGWDYADYDNKDSCNLERKRKAFLNYKVDTSADYFRLPYTFLIDTVIGLKQFAGEVIKSPISFLEAEIFENLFIEKKVPFYKFDGIKAAIEDWRNGVTALTYRYRVDGNQGMVANIQNLLGEIPLVGSAFDQRSRTGGVTADKLFLTRGIFGGDNSAQNMSLWADYFRRSSGECRQDKPIIHQHENPSPEEKNLTVKENNNKVCAKVVPYRYGSNVDVLWALLNISHGYAYDMASEIVLKYNVNPGDSVALSGHSGGVQRIMSTARILYDDGINVKKMYGIAGPVLGYAPCRETKVVLNSKFLQDPVSELSRSLRYITLNLLTLDIEWDLDDRMERQKDDKLYEHVTPGFVDGKTRLKYDGFLCENLTFFFK